MAMKDKIFKTNIFLAFKSFVERMRRLRLLWLMTKEFPDRIAFWEKVVMLFHTPVLGEQVALKQAIREADKLILHNKTALLYSMKAIWVADSELRDFKTATASTSWSSYESDPIHILITDFTLLKISRALRDALEVFEEAELNHDQRRRKALELFRTSLLDDLYTRYEGLKHETLVLDFIRKCISLLLSVQDLRKP